MTEHLAADASAPVSLATPQPGAAERRLARVVLATLAAVTVVVVPSAYLLVGPDGALGAAVGMALVSLLFGGSVLLLVRVAGRTQAGVALLALGSVVRLPLYAISLLALSRVDAIHGRSLAAAVGIGVAVTLAVEMKQLSGTPQLFWVDPDARPSVAASDVQNDTRSHAL